MKYIVRTEGGKEFGPVDQDTLIQWAENGRITSNCQVRNVLMKTWAPADDVPFLEDIVKEAVEVELDDDDENTAVYSLTNAGAFKFVYANAAQRLLAWLFDVLLIGILGLICFIIGDALVLAGIMSENVMFFLFLTGILCFTFFYYTILLGFKAQTFGQWFWGIMIIRSSGQPVMLWRAFIFSILTWLFLPLTPISAITKRTVQDQLMGVRVVKITLRGLG